MQTLSKLPTRTEPRRHVGAGATVAPHQAGAENRISDAELMKRLKDGHKDALGELFTRHEKRIHRYCKRKLPFEAALVDDAVQDVFMRTMRYSHSFKEGAPVLPWLYAIARGACTDIIRKRISSPVSESRLSKGPDHDPLIDSAKLPPAPIEALIQQETKEQIHAVISGLDPKASEWFGFVLREIPYAAVATVLNKSVGSVKSASHRARDLLRAELVSRGLNDSSE